ncbi:MAG TPA: T9SS type A sorting domain-containing protein, partial [Bacteroidota bacterium]|nr:T9SS type A sorting domain-containing protein [Bacteroidota bacterium]
NSDIYTKYERKHNALSIVTRDTSVDVQMWYSGIYSFSIQAMNDLKNGPMNSQVFYGPPSCLTTPGTLSAPIIYSPEAPPADEIINVGDSLELRWSRVEGATTYDVIFNINRAILKSDTLNYSYILILIDYPDTSYTVNTFEPNTEYQFLVGAASYNDHSGFTQRLFRTPLVLGVKDIVKKEGNLLYPNPVRDKAGLRVFINKPIQAEIKIIDIMGKMRSLWQGMLAEGKNEIELNVADIPPCFYNLILDYGRGNNVFKFIKE